MIIFDIKGTGCDRDSGCSDDKCNYDPECDKIIHVLDPGDDAFTGEIPYPDIHPDCRDIDQNNPETFCLVCITPSGELYQELDSGGKFEAGIYVKTLSNYGSDACSAGDQRDLLFERELTILAQGASSEFNLEIEPKEGGTRWSFMGWISSLITALLKMLGLRR